MSESDRMETFTETGLRLASGNEIEADLIVTATGLELLALGGIRLTVDGREIDVGQTVAYKGIMLSGVPNLAFAMGYTNASWTLKADLTSAYVCRLLDHMRARGLERFTPRWEGPLPGAPYIDFSSGYVRRGVHRFPRQGPRPPWRLHQNYLRDILLLRHRPVVDEALEVA
jgi:cation diffusion facilitator CzcD-associated flavoprotein CzcO